MTHFYKSLTATVNTQMIRSILLKFKGSGEWLLSKIFFGYTAVLSGRKGAHFVFLPFWSRTQVTSHIINMPGCPVLAALPWRSFPSKQHYDRYITAWDWTRISQSFISVTLDQLRLEYTEEYNLYSLFLTFCLVPCCYVVDVNCSI